MAEGFTCPSCGTRGRFGLQTPASGPRFWGCHGVKRHQGLIFTCQWTCAEHQALEFGIVTPREELCSIALSVSNLGTALAARGLDTPYDRKAIGEAAESLERLADKVRIVGSYLLAQVQEQERAAERDARRDGAT